ncbi:MAG: 4,5-dioxygenase [Alphaproteobacteria bacterium]|nr:4,5-dioxygenase [Alphaproteobacteria bacterium]
MTDTITGYHAHIYFDEASEETASRVREEIDAKFDTTLGRWHHKPVGPHPRWMYQVAFAPEVFSDLIPWLALNRNGLTIFVHPETGDAVADHTDHALWMGEILDLNIDVLRKLAD